MGLRSQDALDQFLEDDLVDALSFARVGEIVLQVRPRRHDLRYVKPWTWGFPDDEVKRLMDRIVWADDEVGARSGELLGRRQHQGRHSRPVSPSEVLHVLPEGIKAPHRPGDTGAHWPQASSGRPLLSPGSRRPSSPMSPRRLRP